MTHLIRLQIHLLEPALLTALDGDPNSGISYPYIPGSVIKGALIAEYCRKHPEFSPAVPHYRRLFFDPQTRYLNGYLVIEGKRSLPVPLNWERCKDKTIPDLFDSLKIEPVNKTTEGKKDTNAPPEKKAVGDLFFALTANNQATLAEPERQINIHTFRQNRKAGRPKQGDGAVYRYDALAALQTFKSLIICEQEADLEELRMTLAAMPELIIGGARSAGYGRAGLTFEVIQEKEVNALFSIKDSNAGALRFTFTSDTLLRDENGQYSSDVSVIASKIGRALKLPTPSVAKALIRTRVVGGFNRKWGMPLPQALAISAGSVIDLESPALLGADLTRLQEMGIGERREDGFGCLMITPTDSAMPAQWVNAHVDLMPGDKSAQHNTESQALIDLMETRLLRSKLERAILAAGQVYAESLYLKAITKSQLSRLRLAILESLSLMANSLPDATPSVQTPIETFLSNVDRRQKSRKQFTAARIASIPRAELIKPKESPLIAIKAEENPRISLSQWVREALKTIDDEAAWKRLLGLEPIIFALNPQSTLSSAIRQEYTIRLLDITLARAAERKAIDHDDENH